MNNAINEIKNTLEATNSRIMEAEDRISELEDRMVEINESERKKEKRIKRNEDNLRNLQDNIERHNIWIIGVPEEDKKKDHEKILEELIFENFPKMGKEIITQVHSASLCLLVGAFNPFTFKVIIDKYDPVAIYFIVLGSSLYTVFVSPI